MARLLGTMFPHSPDPRCKIRVYLNLRAVSRRMCLCTSGYLLIDRLNALCTDKVRDKKAQAAVLSWHGKVMRSGWIWQLWPALSVRRRTMLIYDEKTGLPLGMTQAHFDECQTQKFQLGWHRKQDGTLSLVL